MLLNTLYAKYSHVVLLFYAGVCNPLLITAPALVNPHNVARGGVVLLGRG